MKTMAFVLLFGLLLASCGSNSILTPPVGPNTDYPCGVQGQVCNDQMCCGLDDICGFDGPGSRCPAGYCCYDGPNWPLGAAPGKTNVRTKQWDQGAASR